MTNYMIVARDTTFYQTPEPFNIVRMNIPLNINLCTMINSKMPVTKPGNVIISFELIGIDNSCRGNLLLYEGNESGLLDIADCLGNYPPFSLNGANNRSLTLRSPVGLIDLNLAIKGAKFFTKQGANLLKHSPCSLIGNTEFSLKLFSRNTTSSRSYEKDGIEPCLKRSSGLVKDSAGGNRCLITTCLAHVNIPRFQQCIFMMSTFGASKSFWPTGRKEPLFTIILIAEFVLKQQKAYVFILWFV